MPRSLFSPSPVPLIFAHRGAASQAPENTLAAFDLAREQGADGIEFDVRPSLDAVPVVIHDARLDRTTEGRGRVDHYRARDLRKLDAGSWFNRRHPAEADRRYRSAKVPLLAEALAWLQSSGCTALVELKRNRVSFPGFEATVLELLHKCGAAKSVTLISFHLGALRRLRQLDSGIRLGLDCTRPLLALHRAQTAGAETVIPHGAFASRRFVDRAHDAGIQVFIWGVETPRGWKRALGFGVDGIITDRPAAARQMLADLGDAPSLRAFGA